MIYKKYQKWFLLAPPILFFNTLVALIRNNMVCHISLPTLRMITAAAGQPGPWNKPFKIQNIVNINNDPWAPVIQINLFTVFVHKI